MPERQQYSHPYGPSQLPPGYYSSPYQEYPTEPRPYAPAPPYQGPMVPQWQGERYQDPFQGHAPTVHYEDNSYGPMHPDSWQMMHSPYQRMVVGERPYTQMNYADRERFSVPPYAPPPRRINGPIR